MNSHRRRYARGQATVEFALSSVVLIVIVLGMIYFGEIGMLSVKVTEASNAAFYDAIGRPAHAYGNNGELEHRHDAVLSATQNRIGDQYRDFDGRTSSTGTSPTLVLTEAQDIQVTCERLEADDLPMLAFSGSYVTGDGAVRSYSYNGQQVWPNEVQRGARCRAASSISLIPGTPSPDVYTDHGWLGGPILEMVQLPVCGIGRAWGGDCNPGTPFMIGDWGLSNRDNEEASECDLLDGSGCDNPGYYAAVEKIYGMIGAQGRKASEFAQGVVGMTPLLRGEDEFFMSFKGEDGGRPFQQELNGTMNGRNHFTTTPGGDPEGGSIRVYQEAHQRRVAHGRCWLGMKCDDY